MATGPDCACEYDSHAQALLQRLASACNYWASTFVRVTNPGPHEASLLDQSWPHLSLEIWG